MKLQSYQKSKYDVLQWAKSVREIVERNGDMAGVQVIDGAVDRFKQGKVNITIMGKAKRGKSTLINALLMRKDDLIAPVDKLPASSVITRFISSDEEYALVHYRDGRQTKVSYPEIKSYVTEEFNSENKKEVAFVEVYGKFTSFDKDVMLIDTPGAGSIHEHHDQILQDVIPTSDVVVFLVTAQMPIDQDEFDLLKSVGEGDVKKLFFVMNKVDVTRPDEIDAAIAHNRKVLEMTPFAGADMHYNISAKKAFDGNWSESNLSPLIADLDAFIGTEKGGILIDSLCNTVIAATKLTIEKMMLEISCGERSVAQLQDDLLILQQKKEDFRGKRELAGKEFETSWRKAISTFRMELPSIENEILTKYNKLASDSSALGLNKFQKQLPDCIKKIFESEMQSSSARLETELRDACEKLSQNFPVVNLGALVGGSVTVDHTEKGALFGTLAGGSATALGATLGFAAAGSTVALTTTTVAAVVTPTIAVTQVATGLLGSLASWLGVSSITAPLTATVATMTAPTVTTVAAPVLWATVLGPVGWTLAGVGALTIPISWACSKAKQRDKMKSTGEEHIRKMVKHFLDVRIPSIEKMAKSVLEDLNLQQERELLELESKINSVIRNKPSEQRIQSLKTDSQRLDGLLKEHAK